MVDKKIMILKHFFSDVSALENEEFNDEFRGWKVIMLLKFIPCSHSIASRDDHWLFGLAKVHWFAGSL